ncbi:protein of unknown function [Candidatus Filomicrobium marinum]|uniref:ChbG/HpnK family deacetylase n=1 Tax=Candidatus Filomicrobium marinum TaxID=1608628 RepID=A0A0D6JIS2_9HYPH|nr:ChbG/HpnK family deacetylase [Candidatus Filomicrobium marinum]CFX34744.1 protein of unknown function [Candidatus Filomicrobium marinum]CPR21841.1 protein of unknown function [Candidatus Filomicrobium marinum]
MVPRFILHADDIGLSRGITRSIVAAIDEGGVRSVSLICNGLAFDEAIDALAVRPHVRVSLHLNLLEGQPLSAAGEVPLLVDGEGALSTTFQDLVRQWIAGDLVKKQALSEQIKREFTAQLVRGGAALAALHRPVDQLRIDSHTHIHALGFVLDAVLASRSAVDVGYVRVPREPWHLSPGVDNLKTTLGLNTVKWGVLNRLAGSMTGKLQAADIRFNPAFLGVLHTGAMTVPAIEAGVAASLRSLQRAAGDHGEEAVEVLLHPGKATAAEEDKWRRRPELRAYYRSPHRDLEAQTARELVRSEVFAAYFEGS